MTKCKLLGFISWHCWHYLKIITKHPKCSNGVEYAYTEDFSIYQCCRCGSTHEHSSPGGW